MEKHHKRGKECLQLCINQVSSVLQFLCHWQKLSQGRKNVTGDWFVSDLFVLYHWSPRRSKTTTLSLKNSMFPLLFDCGTMMYSRLLCGIANNYQNILTIKYALKLTEKLFLSMSARFPKWKCHICLLNYY